MNRPLIDKDLVIEYISKLDALFDKPGEIMFTGETTHVVEGWRRWSTHIEFASSVSKNDRSYFNECIVRVASEMHIAVTDEFPGTVVPLPSGYEERSREPGPSFDSLQLKVKHFDPYSIVYRYMARGLEHDYQMALSFLENGWVEVAEMDRRLEDLIEKFNFQTIQQDPAEFRRRYNGLNQMWNSTNNAGKTHRATPI